MKKLTLITLVLLTVFSCGDEVQFNTPAFQGDKENELWRAKSFTASIAENGFLTITGINNSEIVNLRVPAATERTFIVGDINAIEAEFIDGLGTSFSTNNRPDESISIYPELGEIVIEEIDFVKKTFTGTYRFLAFDTSGLNSIGFTNGIFYRVPLVFGDFPANVITCTDTEMDADAALIAYQATFSLDLDFINQGEYEAACSAYAETLLAQQT